ncbi:hypothetical protein K437DRAFT_257624 [Tilletiaria anomala UBC 951]|uniref:GST N-terminal domain-containing protein n=1 Tax=Tilletiaria anomala (strain ATCC 24038 / CBS 436.72 / UBC 951) TaxID=1037660 RepID=A0A066VX18_TILAU|nr:uncharacterized protein K437DRAFT_257624 [Tilletiaria anomala UBC 951]KDN43100.1 hypothetical protein K437DRAFT_257624 [Tilletiaria anomala UBC 951]
MAPRVILYGYTFSPYTVKISTLLLLKNIPFSLVTVKHAPPQPHLPRPELDLLGVTYRRIPVLSIDGDLFFDSNLIAEEIERRFPPGIGEGYVSIIPGPSTGASSLFMASMNALSSRLLAICVSLLPESALSNEHFVKDREAMTGRSFKPAEFARVHPMQLAALRANLAEIERQAKPNRSRYILGTSTPSYADIALWFSLEWIWALHTGVVKQKTNSAISKQVIATLSDTQRFPSALAWLGKMRTTVAYAKENAGWEASALAGECIKAEEAAEFIKSAPKLASTEPAFVSFNDEDPLVVAGWVKKGAQVKCTPTDTGKIPQLGKLVGLTSSRATLELSSGVHAHFPRIDYSLIANSPSKL